MKVLLIDDEDDIRRIARLSLARVGGLDVIDAPDGATGAARAAAESPDVILLDVMMPGQDGPATLAALRAQESTRGVPVVFLTAKAQVREKAELERLGAAGVLAKPFDPMTLGTELADLLGWV